jgi:hypothetical protein
MCNGQWYHPTTDSGVGNERQQTQYNGKYGTKTTIKQQKRQKQQRVTYLYARE